MTVSFPALMFGALPLIAGVVSLGLAVYLAPHWKNNSAGKLILLMLSTSVWATAYGMELFSPDLSVALWWVTLEYFGAAWVPVLLLSFILTISRRKISEKLFCLLCCVPILEILLVLTNSYHGLMWTDAWLDRTGPIPIMVFARGPGFWTIVAVAYVLLFWSSLILIRSFFSSQGLIRRTQVTLLVGIAFPWLANMLYLLPHGAGPLPDFTPIAFTISGLAFAWGLLRYQMLNLLPLAHQTMVQSMGDPVIALNRKDRILDINPAGQKAFALDPANPRGLELHRVLPDLFQAIQPLRRPDRADTEIRLTSGHTHRDWHLRIFPLKSHRETHAGWLLLLRDITAQKAADAALRKSERIHRTMLEAAPNPIALYDLKGNVTHINPAFTRVFGWEVNELLGQRINFVPEESREATRIALKKTLEEQKVQYDFITQRLTKTGETIDVSINSALCRDHDGSGTRMVVNYTDITRIKETEKALRSTRNFIRSIINSMPSILIGLDGEGAVTHWNAEARQVTGIPSRNAKGLPLHKVFPQLAVHIKELDQIIQTRQVKKASRITLKTDAALMTTDITIYPIDSDAVQGVVIRVDDISDRVRMEEMMVQSEKMLSVGGLAAGMAHEINNPLAGILQNIQVIQNRLTRDIPANRQAAQEAGLDLDALRAYIEQRQIPAMIEMASDAGQRAAKIVSNMLSFSRKSGSRKSPHYLDALLDDTIELARSDYRMKKQYDFKAIEIHREYAEQMPAVPCVSGEIQQVLLNILKNGAEAMSDAGIPSPSFTIRYFRLDTDVRIEIADNGPGMDQETRKRIFEPFFTTKDVGVGTGLGLSVSYFIITENHRGSMAVDSHPGLGTTFIITLPIKETS